MGSVDDILQLCRLCLVKDQVNIPIFDETSDIRQTFLKINSCLPVKVSRDDSLPKKICDGCSYKLDMLYVFRNTSVDSEKQLLSWLDQIGLSTNSMLQDQDAESEKPEVTVKQEALESSDRIEEGEDDNGDMGDDSHSYLMQQQKLPYQDFEFGEPSSSNTDLMGSDEPAPKRAKRAAAMKKHVSEETEEDELDAAMQITKAEDEDSDEIDNPDFGEEEIPSTSADDQDQPGPSGVGKGSIEAPLPPDPEIILFVERKPNGRKGPFICETCNGVLSSGKALKQHTTPYCKKTEPIPRKIHQCQTCDRILCNGRRLRTHMLTHTRQRVYVDRKPKTTVCETCGKTFFKRYLKVHQLSHSGERPHVCSICGKGFATTEHLKAHIYIHTGERRYLCTFCGKGFAKKSSLDDHVRVHTKEKPFKCPICDKGFTQRSSRKIHVLKHASNKPYGCEDCGAGFNTKKLLKQHQCGD